MTDVLQIRMARSHERQALEDLQRRASLANEGDREALLAHPEAIHLPAEQIAAGQVVVAERQGALVGFAVTLPGARAGEAELDGMFVDPSTRRVGAGRRLIQAAEAQARAMGATSLHVIANSHALAFYTACDFDVAGEAQTEFGPAVTLRKALAPQEA
jgi:N-acetylglutamate synthase-like GNAT family acetyltransferase